MKTLANFKLSESPRLPVTVTIPSGASVSDALDLSDTALLGYETPAAWTTAALNIEVSTDNVNWSSAYDAYGSQAGSITSPVVASHYAVDMTALLPWQYVRFRSGTAASPVAQGADRVFTVIARVLA